MYNLFYILVIYVLVIWGYLLYVFFFKCVLIRYSLIFMCIYLIINFVWKCIDSNNYNRCGFRSFII